MAELPQLVRGYVRIRLTSKEPERFLNLCAANHILLWNLLHTEHGYEMNLSVSSFFSLKPICKKSCSRIRVLEKHGLPFFFHKSGKRKAFFLGAVTGFCLLFVLSCFIWNIHIEGNYANSTAELLGCLQRHQITHGTPKKNLHTAEIAELLRREFPSITWVSVKIEGTQLVLNIRENIDGYLEQEADESPVDLVAQKDGTVLSMITRSGTPLSQAGKACKKGEVLVSGVLEILDDSQEVMQREYVHADADIKIRTSCPYYREFPLRHSVRSYCGKVEKEYFFQLLRYRFSTGKAGKREKNRDCYTKIVPVRLTEHFYLPLLYGCTQVRAYEKKQQLYTKKEAKALAEEYLEQFSENLEEKGVQIIRKNVKIEITDTKCTAKGELIVSEEAVKAEPCEISETLPGKDTAEGE